MGTLPAQCERRTQAVEIRLQRRPGVALDPVLEPAAADAQVVMPRPLAVVGPPRQPRQLRHHTPPPVDDGRLQPLQQRWIGIEQERERLAAIQAAGVDPVLYT